MRKLTILSLPFIALAVGLIFFSNTTQAQSKAEVTRIIEANSEKFKTLYNEGNIDELVTLYRIDACILTAGCGIETIRNYYNSSISLGYKFVNLEMKELSLADSIAVEKGSWVIEFPGGQKMRGHYMTEWHLTNGKWLIANDIATAENTTP